MASVRWQVFLAVQTLVQRVVSANPPLAIYLRNHPTHDKGFDSQPSLVLVSEEEEANDRSDNTMQIGNRTRGEVLVYPVLILLVQQRSLRPEDAQYKADTREVVRNTLWKPFSLKIVGQMGTDYDPQPGGWDRSSWGSEFDVTGQRFKFRMTEDIGN